MTWLDRFPWALVIVLCIAPGLMPLAAPHLVEKLGMLARGELVRPLDWFDLVLHGTPWVLLVLKGVRTVR